MKKTSKRPASTSLSPLVVASRHLARQVDQLTFPPPVAYVYNPLIYAREPHELYLQRYGRGVKRVLFLGMNPGPWGMAQTGVPFGEVPAVRDWMGITGHVDPPAEEHPKRPITGFACKRSEVSGRRLWGLMAQRFPSAEAFFKDHLVVNYCPLVFMGHSGANLTPDKLALAQRQPMEAACDEHLRATVLATQAQWLIGVGGFAEARCTRLLTEFPELKVGKILHPSPANPTANRDWAGIVVKQLTELGVW